ncbi:MAG: hypothetical protein ACI30S_05330, partial [Muribaculaceae bacterium]
MKKSGFFESKRLLVAGVAVLACYYGTICKLCGTETNPVTEESQTGSADDTVPNPVTEESQTG